MITPDPLRAEISQDSLNIWMILWAVDGEILHSGEPCALVTN